MLSIDEIIAQCKFNINTLNSGCVECNKKAVEFYESIIMHMEALKGFEKLIINTINKGGKNND